MTVEQGARMMWRIRPGEKRTSKARFWNHQGLWEECCCREWQWVMHEPIQGMMRSDYKACRWLAHGEVDDQWLSFEGSKNVLGEENGTPLELAVSTSNCRPSQVVLVVKNLLANAGDVRDARSILGSGRSSRGEHVSSILAWRIPWTEEPGRLQSMQLQRVEHDWSDLSPMHLPLQEIQVSLRIKRWKSCGEDLEDIENFADDWQWVPEVIVNSLCPWVEYEIGWYKERVSAVWGCDLKWQVLLELFLMAEIVCVCVMCN